MKGIHVLLFLFLQIPMFSQEVDVRGKLDLERIFNSQDFRKDRFGPHKWLAQGSFYTTVEYNSNSNTELILYDSETGDRSILISDEILKDPYNGDAIYIEDYTWSSDEKKILIFTNSQRVWRTNTRGDYYILDLPTKQIKKLGNGLPESSLMFAKFNPDATSVAYVSFNNIYLEDINSSDIRQLTDDGTEHIINGTFDWAYEEEFFCKDGFRWSPDGQIIAYWQIDATHTRDFYLINNTADVYSQVIPIQYPKVGQNPSSARVGFLDINTSITEWIEIPGDPSQNYIPRMQWLSPHNQLLVTQLSRKQNQLKLWLVEKGVKPRSLYEESSETWIDVVNIDVSSAWEVEDQILLDDGKAFVWTSEKDGWRHLYKINTETGASQLLTPGAFDVASVKGQNMSMDLIYYIASPENATQRYLFALDLKNQKQNKLTPENFAGLNNYDISPDGKYSVFKHQKSNDPGLAQIISLPDHNTRQTLYTNEEYRINLKSLDLPKVEFFQVTTIDGVELDGKIIKPSNFSESKKYPVLFYVYGEPAAQTVVDNMDDLWHLYLAQQGYLVISLDNRGTPSLKGAPWRKSIYRKVGIVNSRDQAMATKEILKWDFIDANRIGVWGWSGGGAMTLNLLFRYPEIYKTGIAVAAVTSQLLYDNIYQERYMGLPQENLDDFLEGSPASHVQGLEGHLLYIHGTGDDNVHYQNAEVLINELIRANKYFDLMIYPNRTHGIYEGTNTTRHLYSTMTNYLKKYLPTD